MKKTFYRIEAITKTAAGPKGFRQTATADWDGGKLVWEGNITPHEFETLDAATAVFDLLITADHGVYMGEMTIQIVRDTEALDEDGDIEDFRTDIVAEKNIGRAA